MATPQEDRARFREVQERNTSDTLLRTTQQHHVHLSAMADTKANIVITVSSVVLTLGLARLNDPDLRHAMMVLVVFTLVALLLAVLAVLPKYRPMRRCRPRSTCSSSAISRNSPASASSTRSSAR